MRQRQEQDKRENIILKNFGGIVIFIVVIAILSLFMKRAETVALSFEDGTGVSVTSAAGYSRTYTWDQITAVEAWETLELGALLDGTDDGKERSGTWENDAFGEYMLCADASVDSYCVLYTVDGVLVFNYGSEELTSSVCDAIQRALETEAAAQ